MNFDRITRGVALECDAHGIVQRLFSDAIGMSEAGAVGRSFTSLLDRESHGKGLSFLAELRTMGAVFDWELALPVKGRVEVLHFAGVRAGDRLLAIGAKDRSEMADLYEAMMRIGNEQMNALRSALKETAEATEQRAARDVEAYGELTRLNNELVNLQRELARKNAELERLNELKNQFVGMAAHDLRNPLAAIQAYSEFVLEDMAVDKSAEDLEFIRIIHSSSQFMLHMINELLDITAIESGELQLNLRAVSLPELLAQNVALNQALAQRKDIHLILDAGIDLPELLLDGPKIEQVMNNLLSNAVKYSHRGTSVVVRLTRKDKVVVVSVADQGQGIPADEQGKLFHYFGRTSVRATDGERSTGLGLAIARNIVEGHGGRIWVESEVGRGSTFYVSLPLDR